MKNFAAYMTGIGKMEIRELPMPTPTDEDVIVRIEYVGVCGSDIHFFEEGRIGKKVITGPFILGHECAGEVVELGRNVTHLQVGDKVALEPGVSCGMCEFCKSGRYNLCREVKFMAAPPNNGALRHYLSHPAHMAFKLPANVSTFEGALIEPLAVGLHAARRSQVSLGKTVAILGGGCIGLTTLLAVKAMGASRIIVADLFKNRLNKAVEMGATDVVNATEENTVERILELTGGLGAEFVFETAGNRVTASQTASIVGQGGTIVMVGNILGETPYDFHALTLKEADIKSLFRYANLYPTAIAAIASGKIKVADIATDSFDFEHTQEAFERASKDKQHVVKAIIKL